MKENGAEKLFSKMIDREYAEMADLPEDQLYEEILDSRSITLEQMDMILSYNGSFGVKVRELKMIAVNFFERASDEELNSITAFTASDIKSFFYEIQWDIVYEEKLDNLSDLTTILSKNERIKLNEDELEHIHTIQALNSLWREALINNINGINFILKTPLAIVKTL